MLTFVLVTSTSVILFAPLLYPNDVEEIIKPEKVGKENDCAVFGLEGSWNKDIKIIQVHFLCYIEVENKATPLCLLLSFANQLDNEAVCTIYVFF